MIQEAASRSPARPARRDAPEGGLDWAAAGWAGLVAGALLLFLQIALTVLTTGGDAGVVIRRIAGIALGRSVLPPSTPFTALVFLAAVAVHLPLSLAYARVLASLVQGMNAPKAAVAGAFFGAGLYGLNYYGFTFLFPWFALARGGITLASHVAFGAAASALYVRIADREGAAPARRAPPRAPRRRALRNPGRSSEGASFPLPAGPSWLLLSRRLSPSPRGPREFRGPGRLAAAPGRRSSVPRS